MRAQVLYRLYLAEKLKEPFRKGSRRPDAALLAARDAGRLEAEQVRAGGRAGRPSRRGGSSFDRVRRPCGGGGARRSTAGLGHGLLVQSSRQQCNVAMSQIAG